MNEKIAVVGLGYVGLPVATAFAQTQNVTGFDINEARLADIAKGIGPESAEAKPQVDAGRLSLTADPKALEDATFYIVAVPTPVDERRNPNLGAVCSASKLVAQTLKPGDCVVFESTVYPGVTEDVCLPILLSESGLSRDQFSVGYSPERINPGDTEHTFERIVKVVAADSDAALERVASVYGSVVKAGIHKAPSIMVAEAAKVIENTQRDLNIALMNELAMIFARAGIRTVDVLEAAKTKWNFLPFTPGLVGGHCIGVDPYYLTTRAEELGYHPQVILAGRRINDGMGAWVGQQTLKRLATAGVRLSNARVGVFGLTFKEDVADIRNSRVPDIVDELKEFGIKPLLHDPMAKASEVKREYDLELSSLNDLTELDAIVLAVGHAQYKEAGVKSLLARLNKPGVFVDVKSVFSPSDCSEDVSYWSL